MKYINNFNSFGELLEAKKEEPIKSSGYISLRKLTFKSVIGFGNYKDLTVQNLIDQQKDMELVKMYYNLSNIDFSDEVKQALCIDERRSIKKPGKDITALKFFYSDILNDIIKSRKERGSHRPDIRLRDISMAKKDAKLAKFANAKKAVIAPYGGGKKK